MRVRIGETPYAHKYNATIDGMPLHRCVEADDEAGYVIVLERDPERPYRHIEVRMDGKVVIAVPDFLKRPFP